MIIIGLTGGIGSGKTAATDYLSSRGAAIVDADVCARIVVEPGKPALNAIFDHFGEHLKLADGSLDRGKLREIIFCNPSEKSWLEALLHPQIRDEILCQIENSNAHFIVLVSPLLLETDQHKLCDQIWLIEASRNQQIERTVARDNSSPELVEKIMSTQLSNDQRRERANLIINNQGSLDDLHAELDHIIERLDLS